jgi:adenylate kinase
MIRKFPNILVTGTPGTGKSTLCEVLVEKLSMTSTNVGKLVASKGFHAGRDAEFDAFALDEAAEDKLLDEMEPMLASGNVLVEHHSCDLFPERWFDLVLVLRTENSILYDRLSARSAPALYGC